MKGRDNTSAAPQRDWLRAARGVSRRVNMGWWLDRLNPMLILVTLVSATAIICLRTFLPDQPDQGPWLLAGAAGAIFLSAIAAFLAAKKQFIGQKEGLVRIEDHLHLNNALSSAGNGVGSWPAFQRGKFHHFGLNWRWTFLLLPFLFSATVLFLSIWMPIFEFNAAAKLPPGEPGAWAQMDDWLDTLEEDDVIEDTAVENVREKIEELRSQPEDEWFSHSNMEASDNLRDSLGRDIQDFASEMNTLERDLNALQNYASQLSESSREMLLKEYDEAMKNMALNRLGLNRELLKQLQGIHPKQLAQMQMGQMSSEQMDQLRARLHKGGEKLGAMEGLPSLTENEDFEKWIAGLGNRPGLKPGRGGVSRGKGDAPLFFGEESNLKTDHIEAVRNQDFKNATPGDLLAIGETSYDLDKKKSTPQKGGKVASKSRGGEAVWRDSLMPNEKAVLKRYFK